MDARLRELLRVGRCGPVSRSLGRGAARVPVPGAELVAFGLLGKPRNGSVEVEVERDGSRWALDLRDDAHRLMFLDLYERDLRRRALALVPAGGCVVDVGANVGFWTIPAARALGPGGRVVAFEPNPWAVDRLRRNLALNDDGSLAAVEIVAAAVGAAPGTMELYSDDLEAGASQATLYAAAHDGSPQHVEVPVTTLDDVVTGPVDLVKIDVQGHEMAVLDGARRLFEGLRPPMSRSRWRVTCWRTRARLPSCWSPGSRAWATGRSTATAALAASPSSARCRSSSTRRSSSRPAARLGWNTHTGATWFRRGRFSGRAASRGPRSAS